MPIPEIEADYEDGSPWRPPDPNALADASLEYQVAWETRHDDIGQHNDSLIPMEAATVDSTGTIITGSAGIAVSRLAQGQYEIDISGSPMDVASKWFAHVYPDPVSNDVVWGYESNEAGATAKDTATVEVRFVNDGGNYVDTGFWVGCYGKRG